MTMPSDAATGTAAHKSKVFASLRQVLPETAVLRDEEALRPYECDALSAYRQLPFLVCLPSTIEEVLHVLQVCREFSVPVVTRGAGTGLSGGALPLADGVLLNMARFNRILEIDPDRRTARVEPGVRNLAVSEAVSGYGLFYAPDPSSQIACSIGGNVAENAGGVHCLKYGLTLHNILGIKMITMNGERIEIGGQTLDAPGYDLLALMVGSEGLLGVITEVTVRLRPRPQDIQVILAAFDDLDWAARAVGEIIASGVIPAGLEMMDNTGIRAAENFVHAGYPVDAEAILLCELDGSRAEVEALVERVCDVLKRCRAGSIRTAQSAEDRTRLWAGRKAAFPAVGRLTPDYYCMDGTIPRHELPNVLRRISALSKEYGLPVANVFHAGDGNLHPLILYDANIPGELERTEEFGGRILELCVAVGGTITGEHGVGMEKLNQMCVQFSDAERRQFEAVKEAFDPLRLLNPGKAIPTLQRCAEFGAMHVHRGQLKHPDLERF